MRPPAIIRSLRAFSLSELIVVMAVVVILTTLVIPAVSNFGRATNLVTGGNMVMNLAAYARQIAITKGTITALVLLGAQGTPALSSAVKRSSADRRPISSASSGMSSSRCSTRPGFVR